MYKRIVILLCIVFSSCEIISQDSLSFSFFDKKTYDFYAEKNWEKVIEYGEIANKNSFNSYFIQMRLGIAYFELKNYRKAAFHFYIALEKGQVNDVVLEYLYLSLVYAGKYDEARFIMNELPASLKSRYKYKSVKTLPTINYGYSGNFNNENSINQKLTEQVPTDLSGSQAMLKNYHSIFAGLSHKIGNRVSIFHGYSFINKNNIRNLNAVAFGNLLINENIVQHQYYIGPKVYIGNGVSVFSGFHYINSNFPSYLFSAKKSGYINDYNTEESPLMGNKNGGTGFGSETENTNNDALGPGFGGGDNHDQHNQLIQFGITKIEETQNNLILLFGLQKSTNFIDLYISGTYSNIGIQNHIQGEVGVAYYPFGNLNAYILGSYTLHRNSKTKHIFSAKTGGKILPFCWLEGFGTFGEMKYFTSSNGFFIFNDENPTLYLWGINLLCPIAKNKYVLNISFVHSAFTSFFTETISNQEYYPINYQTYTISGGLKWNF